MPPKEGNPHTGFHLWSFLVRVLIFRFITLLAEWADKQHFENHIFPAKLNFSPLGIQFTEKDGGGKTPNQLFVSLFQAMRVPHTQTRTSLGTGADFPQQTIANISRDSSKAARRARTPPSRTNPACKTSHKLLTQLQLSPFPEHRERDNPAPNRTQPNRTEPGDTAVPR